MGSEKVDCFSNPNNKWLQYLNNNKWFFKENNKWLDNIIILMLAFVKLDHDLYRFQQFIAKAQSRLGVGNILWKKIKRKIKHCLKEQWFMYNKKIVLWWNFLLSCDEFFLSYNDGVLIVVITNCGYAYHYRIWKLINVFEIFLIFEKLVFKSIINQRWVVSF